MANRTGTQLKSDAASADTALASAISTPSQATIQSAIAAFTTAELNARDSVATIKTSDVAAQKVARDIQANARGVVRSLQTILAKFSNSSAAELRVMLQDIQRRLKTTGWESSTTKPTTT